MANVVYENFFLSNEVEDQYNSHLDLQQFCTIDNGLVGTAGMKRVINTYRATDGDRVGYAVTALYGFEFFISVCYIRVFNKN